MGLNVEVPDGPGNGATAIAGGDLPVVGPAALVSQRQAGAIVAWRNIDTAAPDVDGAGRAVRAIR